jgi:hypothetical protein
VKRSCLLLLILLVGASAGFGADAKLILDWNALLLNAIRQDDSGPTLSSRNLAILHASIYDAVNSVMGTHQPYRFYLETASETSEDAAASGAAREVMLSLYPSVQAQTEALYRQQLGAWPATASVTNGLVLGEAVARAMLGWRSTDGASLSVPYIPSEAPGQWRRTPPSYRPPLDPQWGRVAPFCLTDIAAFVPTNLPSLASAEYAAAFNEVKALGALHSSARTPEQSQIAVFWSDFSYTAMPPGHWHEIAATIIRHQNTSFADTARLLALISLAQADAATVCWAAKYQHNFWRPVTAIQRADEDGNPATDPDANWNQFLPSPPFPEYPSGHSTFSRASAEVLARFYGTDALSFTATSDTLPGVGRSFASLAACADEIGMSRIYGGFHFQFSNRDGKATGRMIGEYIALNFLLPNQRLPQVLVETVGDGQVRLRVHGRIGTPWILERSMDLAHWQPVLTNTARIGGVPVNDSVSASSRCSFYRVR